MIRTESKSNTALLGSVLVAVLVAVLLSACTGETGHEDFRDTDVATASERISDREGGNSEGEHRDGRDDGAGSDESGSRAEGDRMGTDRGAEANEAAMSSPITALSQSWSGVLGGLAVSARYAATDQSVHATLRNTLSQLQCYVQVEPHLKSGTNTVGELGPEKLGHLNPGQEARSNLQIASEPDLAGVSYDGYVVHVEVFDCAGAGPVAHQGGEGTRDSVEHGPGAQSGGETATGGGEEGGGAESLTPDETFDAVRNGVRLKLSYHASSNSFKGTLKNTTAAVLDRVRVEVHLSNGTELGPTTPMEMAPGALVAITLPATTAAFTGWTAHAEVGGGDAEGGQSEEHRAGEEPGGERESGGERGNGGERLEHEEGPTESNRE